MGTTPKSPAGRPGSSVRHQEGGLLICDSPYESGSSYVTAAQGLVPVVL
jgi:hypothetical protein